MNKTTAHLQSKASSFLPPTQGILQRKCACGNHTPKGGECDLCKKKRLNLQRRTAGNQSDQSVVPPIVYDVLRSPGAQLDLPTRAFMEPYFGHNFSRVRVHTDSRAAESAKIVNALAYTVGDHIVFGAGQHKPGSSAGVSLIAHELTHVVQQQHGKVRSSEEIGSPDGVYEQEAERASRLISRMQISRLDSSSITDSLALRIKEDEDTQTSKEPPDPRFLYQNGTTTCTFPGGTPSTVINNSDCSRPCTVRHEGVHSTDISPCCAKAGTAHTAAATPAAKQTVETQFFAWMSGNRSWFECRAYAESVRCADELLGAKNCSSGPVPADAACCGTLASYRADKETRRASNCAAAGSLSACPFP